MDMSFLWRAENGETPKIGRIKSLIAEAEIDQATQAEAHLGSKHAQLETELAMVNSELQAVKRENVELRLQEVHVQALTEHAEVNTDSAYRLIQLLDLLKEKDDEILELSKIVRMKDLEREKADLQFDVQSAQIKLLEQKFKRVTTERDEAVCALTRAMMVPELKGEEYEALLSVLPEEQGLVA